MLCACCAHVVRMLCMKQHVSSIQTFIDCCKISCPPGMPAEAAADAIRSDACDVLVNLNGYAGTVISAEIFALRPCPIALSYMGCVTRTSCTCSFSKPSHTELQVLLLCIHCERHLQACAACQLIVTSLTYIPCRSDNCKYL